MEKFKIPITWEVCGEIEVEAESLDEAVEEVNLNSDETVLPDEWNSLVVEGSIEVNYELIEELNPGCKLSREPEPVSEREDRAIKEEQKAKAFGVWDGELRKVEEE